MLTITESYFQILSVFVIGSGATFLLWRKEALRAPVSRKIPRIISSLIAVFSLCFCGLEPRCTESNENLGEQSSLILLTDELNETLLDSLLPFKDSQSIYSIYTRQKNTHFIHDIGSLERKENFTEVHIYGYGLKPSDISRLHGKQVHLHLPPEPNGIIQLDAKREMVVGEKLMVRGKVRGSFDRLLLKHGSLICDSLHTLRGLTDFELQFLPKDTGKVLLSLQLDSLQEVFGIEVKKPEQLSVLFLGSEPTFESNYLKNILISEGHRFVNKIQVGKEVSSESFFNFPITPLTPLNRKLLSKFDVVIADIKTLYSLTRSERLALQNAVQSLGLGVLLSEFDHFSSPSSEISFFTNFQFAPRPEREIRLHWNGRESTPISVEPYIIQSQLGVEALIVEFDDSATTREESKKIIAAAKQKGFGKVALSLAKNVYQWQLKGEQELYASYWTYLLSAISKPSLQTRWHIPLINFEDEPIPFSLFTNEGKPLAIHQSPNGLDTSFLIQSELNPKSWDGIYWSRSKGWHMISEREQGKAWYYVNQKDQWQSLKKEARISQTKKYMSENMNQNQRDINFKNQQNKSYRLMGILIVMFSISAGYLWIESRL